MLIIYRMGLDVDKSTVGKADVIISNQPAEMLICCSNLKWLQLNRAGSDAYINHGILKKSYY